MPGSNTGGTAEPRDMMFLGSSSKESIPNGPLLLEKDCECDKGKWSNCCPKSRLNGSPGVSGSLNKSEVRSYPARKKCCKKKYAGSGSQL